MPLVHPGDGHSNNSRLSPPDSGEIARLSHVSRSIQPAVVPAGNQAAPQRSLRRRLSPQAIEALVARYKAGEVVPALSQEFGISASGLRELLRTEGVPLRGHKITTADADKAIRLYRSGLTINQVAKQVGYSWGTINSVLVNNGVALRTMPGREDDKSRAKTFE